MRVHPVIRTVLLSLAAIVGPLALFVPIGISLVQKTGSSAWAFIALGTAFVCTMLLLVLLWKCAHRIGKPL